MKYECLKCQHCWYEKEIPGIISILLQCIKCNADIENNVKLTFNSGNTSYYNDGISIHKRLDGNVRYTKNGEYHRENGPAIVEPFKKEEWWVNGLLHREDGPAKEYKNGNKQWWVNGELHRVDGPAVKYLDGAQYWLNGGALSKDQFNNWIKRINIMFNIDFVKRNLTDDI